MNPSPYETFALWWNQPKFGKDLYWGISLTELWRWAAILWANVSALKKRQLKSLACQTLRLIRFFQNRISFQLKTICNNQTNPIWGWRQISFLFLEGKPQPRFCNRKSEIKAPYIQQEFLSKIMKIFNGIIIRRAVRKGELFDNHLSTSFPKEQQTI